MPTSPKTLGSLAVGVVSRGAMLCAATAQVTNFCMQKAQRLSLSVMAMGWAFSFCGALDSEMRGVLWRCLVALAQTMALKVGASPAKRARKVATATGEQPFVVVHCPGMCVLHKPAGWEVDVTLESSDANRLSRFLQSHCSSLESSVVHLSAFGHGFVHRLDVPSSGLVLVGTTFQGLLALQWQKNLYEIVREYIVVSHDTSLNVAFDVEARVSVSGKGDRTLTTDVGQPAISHMRAGAHCVWLEALQRVSVIVIRIHTGRRHQIRAHTRLVGHPTVVDGWYTPSSVQLLEQGHSGRVPMRSWVRTPRWDGLVGAPPEALRDDVFIRPNKEDS